MATRKSFSKKDRARLFTLYAGECHLCAGKIDGTKEAWEIEHVIPWALTQDDSDPNLRLAHVKCHKVKTHTKDRPRISKAERQFLKHNGLSKPKGFPKPKGFKFDWSQGRYVKENEA